jgi:hypothetical protein
MTTDSILLLKGSRYFLLIHDQSPLLRVGDVKLPHRALMTAKPLITYPKRFEPVQLTLTLVFWRMPRSRSA